MKTNLKLQRCVYLPLIRFRFLNIKQLEDIENRVDAVRKKVKEKPTENIKQTTGETSFYNESFNSSKSSKKII